jgi:hypothetical protein
MIYIKSRITNLICICLVFSFFAESVSASPLCTQTVRQCLLLHSDMGRDNCFDLATKSPACTNAPLGKVSALRASFINTESEQKFITVTELSAAAPASADCLRNFDNTLASSLIYGDPSEGELRGFVKTLRACFDGIISSSW